MIISICLDQVILVKKVPHKMIRIPNATLYSYKMSIMEINKFNRKSDLWFYDRIGIVSDKYKCVIWTAERPGGLSLSKQQSLVFIPSGGDRRQAGDRQSVANNKFGGWFGQLR